MFSKIKDYVEVKGKGWSISAWNMLKNYYLLFGLFLLGIFMLVGLLVFGVSVWNLDLMAENFNRVILQGDDWGDIVVDYEASQQGLSNHFKSSVIFYSCFFPRDSSKATFLFENLEFFLRFGAFPEDLKYFDFPIVEYYFYLSFDKETPISPSSIANLFLKYPKSNARTTLKYFFGNDVGSDFCSARRMVELANIDFSNFDYLGLISCGVRGPFIRKNSFSEKDSSKVFNNPTHFLIIFHQMMIGRNRLVGPFIDGEGHPPHVLSICLFAHRDIFSIVIPHIRCYRDTKESFLSGEIGTSVDVVKAGWNLADLQAKHFGFDFRVQSWSAPSNNYYFDLFRTVFVQFEGPEHLSRNQYITVMKATLDVETF